VKSSRTGVNNLYARLLFAAIALTNIVAPIASAAAAMSDRDAAALSKASYIYIATFRKDGNQSKAVPVWFIVGKENQVLIETSPTSWKAKRIGRGSPALIWIGSSDGPAFIGKASFVTDPAVQDEVIEQYPKKYTLAWIGFARPSRAKIDRGQIVVIQIEPLRDLPDGFQSQPGTPAPAGDVNPPSTGAH
jgi:hypothetical protein